MEDAPLQELSAYLDALAAAKVGEQRTACKNISNWLGDERNRRTLDNANDAGDSEVTWTSFVDCIIEFVGKAGYKAQPFHLDLFRDCLQRAGNCDRRSNFPALGNVSRHITSTLCDPSHPLQGDYADLLNQLLRFPSFRGNLAGSDQLEYLDYCMKHVDVSLPSPDAIETYNEKRKNDLYLHLEMLSSLFRELYRDDQMDAGKVADIFEFLEQVGSKLQVLSDCGRLATPLFDCIAEILLHFAGDYQARAAKLLQGVSDLIAIAWKPGMDQTKVKAIQGLRVFVCAQIDVNISVIKDTFHRLRQELPSLKSKETIADKKYKLSKEAFYLMDLLSHLVCLRVQKSSNEHADSQSAFKKPKQESVSDWLWNSIFGSTMEGKIRLNLPSLQFLCFLCTKYPSAVDLLCLDIGKDSDLMKRTALARLADAIASPLEDLYLHWVARCLQTLYLGLSDWMSTHSHSIFKSCLDLVKVRMKKTDGHAVTGALFRLMTILFVREAVTADAISDNMETIWGIFMYLRSDVFFAHSPSRTPPIDQRAIEDDLIDWMIQILQFTPLSNFKGQGDVECPRGEILHLVLKALRGDESLDRVKRFARLIMCLIHGSQCHSYRLSTFRHLQRDSFYHESRVHLFDIQLEGDTDHYIWDLDGEDDDKRFERMLDTVDLVTGATNCGLGKKELELTPSEHKIIISVDRTKQMLQTLSRFLNDQDPEAKCSGQDGLRAFLAAALFEITETSLDPADEQRLLSLLSSFVHKLLTSGKAQGSSGNVSLWHIVDHLNTLLLEAKTAFLEKVEFLICVLASPSMQEALNDRHKTVLRSFLMELCMWCATIWKESNEVRDVAGVDDLFGVVHNEKAQEADLQLKLSSLRTFLKVVSTELLVSKQQDLIKELDRCLTSDSLVTTKGLYVTVKKLSVLSAKYIHPQFDAIYLETIEKILPTKKRDEFKHQRKLVALKATWHVARAIDSAAEGRDLVLFEKKVMEAGGILQKFLEAHEKLLNSHPRKYLQRDVRRLLCRTCGQVIIATKQAQPMYIKYILACLKDPAFEVRYEAVIACPTFFRTWDSPETIMAEILQNLPGGIGLKSQAFIQTHIHALIQIGSLNEHYTSDIVEGHCVYLLCEYFLRYNTSSNFKNQIEKALCLIAGSHALETTELIKMHMHSVLCKWFRSGRSWSEFPRELAGCASIQHFAQDHVVRIFVPEVLLFDGQRTTKDVINAEVEIDAISKSSGWNKGTIAERTYATFIAWALQLTTPSDFMQEDTNESEKFRQAKILHQLNQLAQHAFQHKDVFYEQFDLRDYVDDILMNALNTLIEGLQLAACRQFGPEDMYIFTTAELESTVCFCCRRLSELMGIDCRSLLLGLSTSRSGGSAGGTQKNYRIDRLQRLLLHCLRHLKTSKKVQKMTRTLGAVRVLLSDEMIGDPSDTPWLFYHVVSFLLQATNVNWAISSTAAEILRDVLKMTLKGNQTSLLEGGVFTRIVCTLAPLAERADEEVQENIFMELIEFLLEKMRNSELMQSLPPFPRDPLFSKVNKICEATAAQSTFSNFLHSFTSIEGPLPPILQEAYLSRLLVFLQSHDYREKILPDLMIGEGRKAQRLIQKLLQMTQSQEFGSMKPRALLGRCIACCFADLHAINASSAEDLPWTLPTLHGMHGTGRTSTKPRPSVEVFALTHIGERMVRALKSYTESDESVDVAESAAGLLKDFFRPNSPFRNDLMPSIESLDKVTRSYLTPYISEQNTVLLNSGSSDKTDAQPISNVADSSLWKVEASYDAWICKVSHSLCFLNTDHPVWPMCARLCWQKAAFSELLFPHLLMEAFMFFRLQKGGKQSLWTVLSDALRQILESPSHSDAQLAATRTVLRALEFFNAFRCEMVSHQGSPFADEILGWPLCYWFDIPYIIAANAAMRCGAPLTALLLLEMHCTNDLSPSSKDDCSPMDKRPAVEQAMIDAYQDIDEPDGNSAFDRGLDLRSVMSAYDRDGEWAKALGMYDTIMMRSDDSVLDAHVTGGRLFKALTNSGLTYLASNVVKEFQHSISSDEIHFEASWREGKWSQTVVSGLAGEDLNTKVIVGFHRSLYQALSLCNSKTSSESLLRHISDARFSAMHELENCNLLQSAKRLLPALVKLRMIEDVTSFVDVFSNSGDSEVKLKVLLSSWEQWYRSMEDNDFQYWEPALALHSVLLKFIRNDTFQQSHYCLVAKFAMKCNNLPYARSALCKIQCLSEHSCSGGSMIPSEWWLRLAKMNWKDRKEERALALLLAVEKHLKERCGQQAVGPSTPRKDCSLLARVLSNRASWMASSRSSSWYEVEKVFQESVQVEDNANRRYRYASFMDTLYTAEQSQVDEMRKQQKDLEKQRKDLDQMKKVQSTEYEVKKSCAQREKYLNFHETNLKERNENKKRFLLSALENYLRCIDSSKKKGQCVFRVLHLWFENNEDKEVNETVLNGLKSLRNCKEFLMVVPQIISRLDKRMNPYQDAIWFLIKKLLEQEPQELLFHIQAAKNEELAMHQVRSSSVSVTVNANKVQAAKDIIASFTALSAKDLGFDPRELLAQSSQLIDAYIELADFKQKDCEQNKKYLLTPLLKKISWSKERSKIVVPTSGEQSSHPPKVASFDGWTYPGGITKPKKITCMATNGSTFFQIVKGGDDPRADSVTSQLFSVINVLLKGNNQCRRRRLEVRTYKVIPLHAQAGLIEWVADAVGIGSVLGATVKPDDYKKSLHGRYDPTGWTHKACIEQMRKVQEGPAKHSGSQLQDESRNALEEIYAHTRPVLRHYFFDRSSTAPHWFQLRLAYTRSVAASSMAGFIIGLGDRHTNNILLLERTGEVVHIDLGIVFEYGRLLPMPELVPFRLSRDIVDGMGPAGTDGVFSRCCEETLHVLRENRQALLAVVDVLMHDPLASWKLSAGKKASAQRRGDNDHDLLATAGAAAGSVGDGAGRNDDDSGGMSLDASFVRARVKEKLEGWDRGELLSVEGQVKKLIVDARSIDNLSMLYRGWSAWL